MSEHIIKIGTRGSKLALWQANYVADLLKNGGVNTEILIIETKGDKILDVTIGNIGGKGVFTEEIEEQLLLKNIDIAIHSAKDMPSELPSGLELLAFTEREKVNDVVIGNIDLTQQKGWLVGTSSTRRVAFLKHFYPHVRTIAVRGNLQTRIRKMQDGQCDGLLLAFAGVHRMGYDEMITHVLPSEEFTTPAGQGSIAIEVSNHLPDEKKQLIHQLVNHRNTELCVRAERAFLKTMHGGCSIPVFVYSTIVGEQLRINGGIVSLDGKNMVRKSISGNLNNFVELGEDLAKQVLECGGREILEKIKMAN